MVKIVGPEKIGAGTIISDVGVIIGHPSKENMSANRDFEKSEGAIIGERCVIRSGSVIYENVVIGDAVQIAHHVVVRERAYIGDGCALGNNVVVHEDAKLKRNVRLQENVMISEAAEIGENVFIGPAATFTGSRHMTAAFEAAGIITHEDSVRIEGKNWQGPSVIVEDGVRIGSNAVILAGVRLGKDCVVAAGAVVSSNVPAGAMVAGNPARVIKTATKTPGG